MPLWLSWCAPCTEVYLTAAVQGSSLTCGNLLHIIPPQSHPVSCHLSAVLSNNATKGQKDTKVIHRLIMLYYMIVVLHLNLRCIWYGSFDKKTVKLSLSKALTCYHFHGCRFPDYRTITSGLPAEDRIQLNRESYYKDNWIEVAWHLLSLTNPISVLCNYSSDATHLATAILDPQCVNCNLISHQKYCKWIMTSVTRW